MIEKEKHNSISDIRLANLTSNLNEAWKSVSSAVIDFSLLVYEAFESKVYQSKYKTWGKYIESELPIKRRQADYYRKVGEFYYKYENVIISDLLETFTQKDFLKLISATKELPDENHKKKLIKRIFKAKDPQSELKKVRH